jgi:hypothetical protein
MPRSCTICDSDHRQEIDRDLVHGRGLRTIAHTYGVGEYSVRRHRREHLHEVLAKGYTAEEATRADELLLDVRRLQEKTVSTLLKAEAAGEYAVLLRAVREARENIELLARLRGELDTRPVINLVLSSEWLELRALIVAALEPHPDARESVLRAIRGVDNGAA